ncbi:Hypothetical protein CGLY_15610 [Corynebacterium glyciniphilum AJ 3170]|uniref:Uncharacterized protein n=1 Tax=Corynebacterium glyciniphilum AJ 3170 TaxID=1404245 RepID=X5DQR4_9CORY|nr:hypothetical protein [Corynebacterium glyciniphilum]AHW65558.1 Hypothetical protein CGLY_15610 [Corynebacterium glyciniphilum AJ 3170]
METTHDVPPVPGNVPTLNVTVDSCDDFAAAAYFMAVYLAEGAPA